MNPTFGLTGRIKLSVLNGGRITHETPWMPNLWMDQGLNRIAEVAICDAFAVAVKGTGLPVTFEDQSASANTYSIASGDSTLTRTAGTRSFTTDDIGKLIRFTTTPFQEFHISGYTDATTVELSPPAAATITNKKINLYGVQLTAVTGEVGRSDTYGLAAADNSTATAANVRTFTRSFIFPSEDTRTEVVEQSNFFAQTGFTVNTDASTSATRLFDPSDVGSKITFLLSGLTATITAYVDTDHVTVDISQTNLAQNISLSKSSALRETVTGTYSRSGTNVTRASGARDFVTGDVGKIINFRTDNVECKIVSYTSATVVVVDVSGTLSAQSIYLYGFTDYQSVGFSDSTGRAANINILVPLASSIRLYPSTELIQSDQLKVTYQCKLTVTPNTSTAGSLASIISDPGNLMSGNKNGNYAIESFATSTVKTSGDTDVSFPCLEPYYGGSAGFSTSSDAIAPLSNKVRSADTSFTDLIPDDYNPGAFTNTYQAIFGLNDAVNPAWRTLMIYDPDSTSSIFAFVFTVSQKKDASHTFQIGFRKTWGRDLS